MPSEYIKKIRTTNGDIPLRDEETNSELVDVRVGADGKTYTSAGDAVREQNSAISADIFSIMEREKNLVSRRIEKAYWANDGVLVSDVADYNAYVVDVVPGMIVSFNTSRAWSDNFNLMIGSNDTIIGKFDTTQKKIEDNIQYSIIPVNVKKLHITIPSSLDAKGLVALEGKHNLTGVTMETYPIGSPVNPVLKENIKIKNFGSIIEKIESKISPNIYKNLVINKEEGYFWASVDNIVARDNYVAIKVDVRGGGVFSFNNEFFWNDHFCFLKTKNGESFVFNDSYKKQEGDILYTELNADAEYLYLTANLSNWDTVVLPEKVDLTETTENTFPISKEKGLIFTSPLYGRFFDEKGVEIKPPKIRTFYCGVGEEYTKLKDAIENATQYMDSIVIVRRGMYDLVEEFGGEEHLNSLDQSHAIRGLILKNNVHVIFEPGAECVFDYKGGNPVIHESFSIFNSDEYGFTLENVKATSRNCRYTVHDERSGSLDSYVNKYLNCILSHDSSQSTWGAHQCIGGGLGQNGFIYIDSCEISAVGMVHSVSYHNNSGQEADNYQSHVIIKNCYLTKRAECGSYGKSTLKTIFSVINCSQEEAGVKVNDIPEGSVDNMEVHEWNNYVRQSIN